MDEIQNLGRMLDAVGWRHPAFAQGYRPAPGFILAAGFTIIEYQQEFPAAGLEPPLSPFLLNRVDAGAR